MSTVFITGSGTGVGKTLLARLAVDELRSRGIEVDALKPIVTGFDPDDAAASDSGLLLAALGQIIDAPGLERISPWRLRAPLSPNMAAAREGRTVPFDALVDYCRRRAADGVTIIEGVGGVLVPLDDAHTVADWIGALDAPAVLVTGSYLGAISHTLTAFEVLRARDIAVRSIVVSASADEPVATRETADVIERFCRSVPVFVLERMTAARPRPDVCAMLGLPGS